MKTAQIKVGTTYANRGAGTKRRTVLGIGPEHRPEKFWSVRLPPAEDGVLYEQDGIKQRLYISSFAKWCGKVAD